MFKKIYKLKGKNKGKPYQHISTNMKDLQIILTKVLRAGGSGFIRRAEDE